MNWKLDTKAIWNGADVIAKNHSANQKSLLESAITIEGQAAAFCPIDTGRLRGSISVQMKTREHKNQNASKAQEGDFIGKPIKDNEALVGTNVKYAVYQEYGTAPFELNKSVKIKGKWVFIRTHPGIKPQPFMRPAIDLNQGKTVDEFKKQYKKEYEEYLKEKRG